MNLYKKNSSGEPESLGKHPPARSVSQSFTAAGETSVSLVFPAHHCYFAFKIHVLLAALAALINLNIQENLPLIKPADFIGPPYTILYSHVQFGKP